MCSFKVFTFPYQPYNQCANEIPDNQIQNQIEPIEFKTNLPRRARSPCQVKLKRKTMWKGVRDVPNHKCPPERARNVKQDGCENQLCEIRFEDILHENP